ELATTAVPGLQHRHLEAAVHQFDRRGQTGQPAPNDGDPLAVQTPSVSPIGVKPISFCTPCFAWRMARPMAWRTTTGPSAGGTATMGTGWRPSHASTPEAAWRPVMTAFSMNIMGSGARTQSPAMNRLASGVVDVGRKVSKPGPKPVNNP